MFADDTQLNHSVLPSDYDHLTLTLQNCVSDIKSWMTQNRLKLNEDKTDALRFTNPTVSIPNLSDTLHLCNATIEFSDNTRNLGFLLDSDLTMKKHITKTCQAAYIELRRISSIRHYLTQDATKTLVQACIISRLDYCNSLLIGCPQTVLKPLQQVQNSAAKLIFKARKTHHCTPLFKELHWLPIEKRLTYKSACLSFHVISGTAPAYLTDLLQVYTPSRSLRSASDNRIFRVPRYNRKQHGGRAFSYSAVQIWNSLPYSVRHSPSFQSFKTNLKTHLFKQ